MIGLAPLTIGEGAVLPKKEKGAGGGRWANKCKVQQACLHFCFMQVQGRHLFLELWGHVGS